MKLYIVKCWVLCGENRKWLVKANNKKEALNKIWEGYYIPKNKKLKEDGFDAYCKKDLTVSDVEKELFENKNITYVEIH